MYFPFAQRYRKLNLFKVFVHKAIVMSQLSVLYVKSLAFYFKGKRKKEIGCSSISKQVSLLVPSIKPLNNYLLTKLFSKLQKLNLLCYEEFEGCKGSSLNEVWHQVEYLLSPYSFFFAHFHIYLIG